MHFQFIDKRVRVTGRPYMPGRDTQHIMATHFQLTSIDLAPGETPYTVCPTQVPAPPFVRTAEDLEKRAGRWAMVVGRVEFVKDDPDGVLGMAGLCLEDGTIIIVGNILISKWAGYNGKIVTVTSRVHKIQREEEGKTPEAPIRKPLEPVKKLLKKTTDPDIGVSKPSRYELIGTHAVCEGVVEGCGMNGRTNGKQ